MKAFVTGAAMLLCAASAAAYEPDQRGFQGPYVSVQAGAVFADVNEVPDFYESDTGISVLGSLGYTFGSGLRIEGEASWRRVETGPQIEEEISNYGFFANMLYEWPSGSLRPYVGAGAGVARIDSVVTDGFVIGQGETTGFAYQFIGGMSVRITGNMDIITDYRYTATGGLELFGFDADVDSHNITGGVRVHF